MKALALVVVLGCAAVAAVPGASLAQDIAMEVNAEPVKTNLERQVGKRVRLRLVSGQDIEGTVFAVGTNAVHVARLAGMDFFDAAVRLDQIAAVIVRAR